MSKNYPNRRTPSAADWLVGGGEMGERIRAKDWAATPLGPVEQWPQSLRSAVSILLPSKAQICLFWGLDLVAIYNDAYRPTLGVKHPGALGLPAREVWSEFWEDVLRPLLEGVLNTGEALWASDYPFFLERYGYPEETYFDISYDPVRDETGRVGGVFCIVSETTGRVLGERRLRTLRDLGRAMSDAQMPGDVFRRAAAVLERAREDVSFALLYDWDRERRIASRLTAVGIDPAHSAAPERIDADDARAWPVAEALTADGLFLDAERVSQLGPLPGGPWPEPAHGAAVLPIAVPGQTPYGLLIAGISPRRALDDDYRDFLRLIASAIANAVANARAIEEERKRAEALAEIDRAKTAFFSNVSHEFRTPLTLMLGPVEDELAAASARGDTSVTRERLETAYRNGVRLLKLVNTLLDFSRLEAGRVQASYEPVDLARFTAQLASNFASACEKAGLLFIVDCPPLAQPVYVDRDMWEKIVLNLISNAFKFTFEGEIEIRLRAAADGAELRVRDTGVGIAAHEIPRLFERFHRVEGTRARTHEGSGIGLALVQELVHMHGGDIRAESEPERGSTFTVRLPFGSSHLPAERLGVGRPATTSTGAAAFVEEALGWLRTDAVSLPTEQPHPETRAESEHLLVVDDNADMRDYLTRILNPRWSVTSVPNGERALAALRERRFDLVLSDVMMPQMDGFALLNAIRADPARRDTPVILLSARAGEEARLDGLEAGADDYLVKPFSARELIAQVKSQLALVRIRREAAQDRERLLAREQAAKREAELQHEHLVLLFMQAPNPIVILRGSDYIIELANLHTCRVWGRKHEDLINRPLFDALPELRGQVFKQLLDGVMRTGVPYEGKEIPAKFDRRNDGMLDTVYFNFVYSPLRSVAGAVEGILVIAFDVTDEVIARQQMDALRTQAESANRAKDEFLAMLGHELRNPLSPIVTALQLMRLRGVQSSELKVLERQVGHLTRLVDDLLDVSRITRGMIELRKRPMEVAEAVLKAMEIASPLLEQRQHRVDLRVERSGLGVMADPERLAQIFANLLTNAAKYSDPGSHIAVRAQRTGDRVSVTVKDDGMGIAPEMIDRIFDLFVQQPQTLARSQSGLGLGLAIVRNLVKLHDGRVRVSSPGVGQGSEFTVELPALAELSVSPAAAEPPAPLAIDIATSSRILVVDDNVDVANTLRDALQGLGHIVAVAYDGPSALSFAKNFKPQLALLDIGLPAMDGYELAQHLRAMQPESPLKLIAISGYGLDADFVRSRAAGFQQHLVKPIDLAKLQEAIR